ncbi:MAG: aldo/keto reductase [Rubrivivax sp.]|nr:aldo/keto reductase [Rubrivivax sp.]
MTATTPTVILRDGTPCPAIGLGTWRYGESSSARNAEIAALRSAIDIGYRLMDTAEMYGDGGAERVLGEALADALKQGLRREEFFIVTKAYPHHADRAGMRRACDASLRRLGLDRIDLYLLHWRGGVPLAETVAAFDDLRTRGRIARWGVSNFDVDDLRELAAVPGGEACAANQVYLSLRERGPEFALLPFQLRHGMPLMAYSPIDQGALARGDEAKEPDALARVAKRHGATRAQLALAALLTLPGVIAIPKSSNAQRLQENWDAARLALSAEDRAELDRDFPPPRRKKPLAMT